MDYTNLIDANHNNFYEGFSDLNSKLHPKHPVDIAQRNYKIEKDNLNYDVLKRAQGIHAPLRLMMEKKLCANVGRLPFLPSSNLMLDVLEGTEDDISFSSFFKDPMEQEHFINPNIAMEKFQKNL